MRQKSDSRAKRPTPDFEPVRVRDRFDGWRPEKQVGFIEALAECGCVEHACERVGMSARSAYALRRRVDAQSFRIAWDAALDYAIRRLSDAAFSRALNGVARPVFFQGQQIGERRYYDERLTQFLLRYRDPVRYGRWNDRMEYEQPPEGAALLLAKAVNRVCDDAYDAEIGAPPAKHPPFPAPRTMTRQEHEAEVAARKDRLDEARRERAFREELGDDYDKVGWT
jgi:hypothetical protein